MSVIIRGMKLPKNCYDCAFNDILMDDYSQNEIATCDLLDHRIEEHEKGCVEIYKGRAKDCPLIELPPHGRLVDADALLASNLGGEPFKSVIRRVLMQAPTIIEAENEDV